MTLGAVVTAADVADPWAIWLVLGGIAVYVGLWLAYERLNQWAEPRPTARQGARVLDLPVEWTPWVFAMAALAASAVALSAMTAEWWGWTWRFALLQTLAVGLGTTSALRRLSRNARIEDAAGDRAELASGSASYRTVVARRRAAQLRSRRYRRRFVRRRVVVSAAVSLSAVFMVIGFGATWWICVLTATIAAAAAGLGWVVGRIVEFRNPEPVSSHGIPPLPVPPALLVLLAGLLVFASTIAAVQLPPKTALNVVGVLLQLAAGLTAFSIVLTLPAIDRLEARLSRAVARSTRLPWRRLGGALQVAAAGAGSLMLARPVVTSYVDPTADSDQVLVGAFLVWLGAAYCAATSANIADVNDAGGLSPRTPSQIALLAEMEPVKLKVAATALCLFLLGASLQILSAILP